MCRSAITNLLGGLAFFVMGVAVSVPAQAVTIGVDFPMPDQTANDNQYNLGWSFTANSDVTVVGLGNFFGQPVWPRDQQVGLWDSSHNLLASAFVRDTDALLGSAPWRFRSITPVQLTGGQTYVVGGQGGAVYTSTASPTFDPRISYIELRLFAVGDGSNAPLFEPTDTNAGGCCGWFGGNIELASQTPLPAALPLFTGGLGVLALLARRRKRKGASALTTA